MRYLRKFNEAMLSEDHVNDIKDILLELQDSRFLIEYRLDKENVIGIDIRKFANEEDKLRICGGGTIKRDDIPPYIFDAIKYSDFYRSEVNEIIERLKDYCNINQFDIKIIERGARHRYSLRQVGLELMMIFIYSKK